MAIASLGMYDEPEFRFANDQFWQVFSSLLSESSPSIKPPATLDRNMPLAEQWRHPQLFMAQICGYPYCATYYQYAQLVATPRYTHDGCEGNNYSSFIVTAQSASTRLADYKDKTLAANSADSLSGLVALELTLAQLDVNGAFFHQCLYSGAHRKSMTLVAEGKADICCIDAVTWALAAEYRPELTARLQVIGQTQQLPALPLITSKNRSTEFVTCLRNALNQTLNNSIACKALGTLGISGFDVLSNADYAAITDRYTEVPDSLKGHIAHSFSHCPAD